MKKVISVIYLVFITLASSATNYDKLWDAVNRSSRKDQPRTTMSLLKNIITQAKKDKAYGEYLAAEIKYANTEVSIAPDSLQKHLDMLKRQCETTKDDVLRAVTYAVLAYSVNDKAEEYYDKALADADLLAATDAKAYNRLITKGSDDDVFNNDLLSVIGNTAGRYQFLKDYYLAHGNRRAACIELLNEIESINSSNDDRSLTHRRQMQQAGIKEYSDIAECALLANSYYRTLEQDDDVSDSTRYAYLTECISRYGNTPYASIFSNSLASLTQARYNISIKDMIVCKGRNISDLQLQFYLLSCDGRKKINLYSKDGLKSAMKLIDGDVRATVTRTYSHAAYEEFSDTISLPELSHGVYLVKATGNGMTSHALLHHSDLAIIHQALGDKDKRLVVVSATTGMPVANATIVLSEENTYKNEVKQAVTLNCNSKGEAVFNGAFKPNQVYVSTDTDKAFHKKSYYAYFNLHDSRVKDDIITVMTDRAIYRPGQKLQGAVIVHNAFNEDSIHCVPGKKVYITLRNTEYEEVCNDSLVTDHLGNGGFSFTLPKDGRNGRYTIECHADDARSGSTAISIEEYKRPTFSIAVNDADSLSSKTYKDGDSVCVTMHAETLTRLPLQKAQVVYTIKRSNQWFWYSHRNGGNSRTIAAGDTLYTDNDGNITIPLTFSLPEEGFGRFIYTITAKATDTTGETHEQSICLYARRSDNRYPDTQQQKEVFKLSDDAFRQDGKPVTLTVTPFATITHHPSPNTYLIYTLHSGKKVIEQSAVLVKDTVYTRQFRYDKKYGQGLTLSYAFIHNGELQTFSTTIRKPRPDLKLKTTWTTFRDRTQPGNKEQWTLKVENGTWNLKSGTWNLEPTTTLTATVFDSSLDMLKKLYWSLPVLRNSYSASAAWRALINRGTSLNEAKDCRYQKERNISLAFITEGINEAISKHYDIRIRGLAKTSARSGKVLYSLAATDAMQETSELELAAPMAKAANAVDMEQEEDLSHSVRTNLGETAYFTPSLVADKDGNINISFTMPETMTTWRVLGIAHDTNMRYNIIDTTCVATKSIIVKPNVPRFLRENDSAVLSASVSNTTDEAMPAKVVMQLIDPETQNVLWQKTQSITIAAKSTETVAMEAAEIGTGHEALLYRVAATSATDDSSDGEQHFIPILPEKQTVTTTVAFTQHGPGTYRRDLSDLLYKGSTNHKLTLQYVEHAVQMILDAVPKTVTVEHEDAISLAAAAYVMNLFNIADTTKVAERLARLQNADGSWSWWQGMDGSVCITTAVSKLLARLQYQQHATAATDSMLKRAMPFMAKYINDEAQELRKLQKKYPKRVLYPSDLAIDIMYINALSKACNLKPGTWNLKPETWDLKPETWNLKPGTWNFLITLLEKMPIALTIYGKAHSAAILALHGRTKKANEYLESLKQYTVYTEEAGRYYDTDKAYYSWRNYRIPTEVAAMEAIRLVTPRDTTTIQQMQRWLLHEKRTQQWDTNVNTADAIYAFLQMENGEWRMENGKWKMENDTLNLKLETWNLKLETWNLKPETWNLKPEDKVFTHEKTTNGTSWGALYIQQEVPLSNITSQGTGFTITREIIPTAWTSLSPEGERVGERGLGSKVTVRITINADRDYDLVTVTDNRPANLEPVNQLSGYQRVENHGYGWGAYVGCYREVKDTATNYYFNTLSKGKHVIETDYYIDRQGTYQQGLCTVLCTYAPEFRAIAK